MATSPRPATAALTAAAAASDVDSGDGTLAAGDVGRDEVVGEGVDEGAVDGLGPGVTGVAGNRAAEEDRVAGDWTRLPAFVVEPEGLPSPDEGTGADVRGASTGALTVSTVPSEPTDTPGYEGTGPLMTSEAGMRSEEISLGVLPTVAGAIPFVPRIYDC
ncbi:MAG: hypothetical protein JRN09_02380 [Nitrososphaerota archaeon]|nr:hypothetical protein [Nitrososphaerota archaeon]